MLAMSFLERLNFFNHIFATRLRNQVGQLRRQRQRKVLYRWLDSYFIQGPGTIGHAMLPPGVMSSGRVLLVVNPLAAAKQSSEENA